MKVAVLEWICGGGLVAESGAESLESLRQEGWAMLRCIALALARAGHDVSIALDDRFWEPQPADVLRDLSHVSRGYRNSRQLIPTGWRVLADQCDFALVIAPESDGILEQTLGQLDGCRANLVNCQGMFLRQASDKLATSQACEQAGLRHPPTCLAQHVNSHWRRRVQARFENDYWVVKSRSGAGADALHVVSEAELDDLLSEIERSGGQAQKFIVQPWLAGASFSRSAIVDLEGRWHWLPLVTQQFAHTRQRQDTLQTPEVFGCTRLTYQGGAIASAEVQHQFPRSLTDKLASSFAGGAAGWVGVDFVLSDRDQQWYVIEVNPRCTTSLVGLCESYSDNLAAELLQSQISGWQQLAGNWSPVRFSADGRVTRAK